MEGNSGKTYLTNRIQIQEKTFNETLEHLGQLYGIDSSEPDFCTLSETFRVLNAYLYTLVMDKGLPNKISRRLCFRSGG